MTEPQIRRAFVNCTQGEARAPAGPASAATRSAPTSAPTSPAPLYLRGKRDAGTAAMHETLTLDQPIQRLLGNREAFVTRVRKQPA